MRKLKWILPLPIMLLVLSLAVPVTYAGILWRGIDPELRVDGRKVNIWIEWPEPYTCTIDNPIEVEVKIPKGASYSFIGESADVLDGCDRTMHTRTRVDTYERGSYKLHVKATVNSEEIFPVRVKVYLENELVALYTGESNSPVTGKPIKLNGRIKPVLLGSY